MGPTNDDRIIYPSMNIYADILINIVFRKASKSLTNISWQHIPKK
jgi:hypothetical protein